MRPIFSANLNAVRDFLGPEGKDAFDALWRRLARQSVPTLCRLPRSGRPFLAQPARSREALELAGELLRKLRPGEEVRELVLDDYVLLYLVRQREVVFPAIQYHLQLSFDLRHFWASP